MPKLSRSLLAIGIAACLLAALPVLAQQRPIVLKAATVIDGKGGMLHDTILVVQGEKIARIGGEIPSDAVVYDLTRLTVTPGWIDTHSHIYWHFDHGRLAGREEPPSQAILHAADNAAATLDAGFTTIQSPGSPQDKFLRDAIARGILPARAS